MLSYKPPPAAREEKHYIVQTIRPNTKIREMIKEVFFQEWSQHEDLTGVIRLGGKRLVLAGVRFVDGHMANELAA